MILYHGSNIKIERIDLSKGKPNKDFGRGFYATDIKEQAIYWSERIANRYGQTPEVTLLKFDLESAIRDGLKIKRFDKPNQEWATFVMSNRKNDSNQPIHDFDIVIGPVANDRMSTLFGLYEMEIITLDDVVKGLEYKGLNSQYFFHTEKSLKYLTLL
jgi:hypothetical protein